MGPSHAACTAPLILKMKINIVGGTGVMGRVHKRVFEEGGHSVICTGRNSNPSIIEAASNSDITIISVPINAFEEVVKEVGPNCSAIMDFTGLKELQIKTMIENTIDECEVGGLHPLYGDVKSVEGKTVIYCKTQKSGEKCNKVVSCLKKSGALIKEMDPKEHDFLVGGVAQNARVMLFEAYAGLLFKNGIKVEDLYMVASPPTRVLLDLIARQVNGKNEELYRQMRKENSYSLEIAEDLKGLIDGEVDFAKIREIFGRGLKDSQDRARKLLD